MYKYILDTDGSIHQKIIKRMTDNAFVPFDPANTDYQKYLEWLAEGNTPEPADEQN
jgi:hypothetical protein